MNGSTNGLGALGARLWRAALDLLYPARCAACDAPLERDGDLFCGPCTLTLAPLDSACPRCARPSGVRLSRPPPCLGCLQRPPRFDAAVAGYEFGGAIAEAIRSLKWHKMPELAAPLGELCYRALAHAPPGFTAVDLIVPVPLHASSTRPPSSRRRCASRRERAARHSGRSRSTRVPSSARATRRRRPASTPRSDGATSTTPSVCAGRKMCAGGACSSSTT
jgi:predicted amidophosphoribosyltransferase